jgi:predicted phage terminase large subunit-like protein
MDGRLLRSNASSSKQQSTTLPGLRKQLEQLVRETETRRLLNTPEAERVREQAAACKASFAEFFRQAWAVMEPAKSLIEGYHTDACLRHLQAVGDGEIRRLVANLPPGFGKSSMFSVAFPAWVWTRNPYEKFLCSSYAMDLSIRDRRNCRVLIESEWYQSLFGDVFQLASDQSAKSFFENDKRGFMQATATFASGTGKRADSSIIDDPNNAMAGQAEVTSTREWFGKTWIPRLNDRENGVMLLVMQRMGANDLTAHVLELGGWEHLCLPMEYESARKCYTSIGWEDPRTEDGELLCPELVDEHGVDELKHSQGSFHYSAQQNQAPVPSSGGQFKREWLRYAAETPSAYLLETARGTRSLLKAACRCFATVDLAISSKQTADYTVVAVWAETPTHDLILIDLIRARLDNPAQVKLLRLVYQQYHPDYFRIERTGYQLSLIQQALAEGIPCREYTPTRDKVARASSAAVWMENEKLYLLKSLIELPVIETELLQFPKGAHDDVVDNFSMAADEVLLDSADIPFAVAYLDPSPTDTLTQLFGLRRQQQPEGEPEMTAQEQDLQRREEQVARILQQLTHMRRV